MVRLVTYNVHSCVGIDGRLDVGRIAAVITALSPDIVALQELDVGRARTGGVDQASALAGRLGMSHRFHASVHVESERYGDAILTHHPECLVKVGTLPGDPRLPWLEPRAALWTAVRLGEVDLQVINTHLGLTPREQRRQVEALLSEAWLGQDAARVTPLMLVGDLNATPVSRVYGRLASRLIDARRAAKFVRATPTFPSRLPILALDHVFISAGIDVEAVWTPRDRLSRHASDHLPLVVDFRLTRT